MNIFEKYGSYEAVRQAAVNYKNSGDMVTAAGLELQCLEYRRQHNIYEVGDSIIVNDEASSERIYVIEKNHDNEYFKIRSKDGFRYCRHWRIDRHANDAEIQAGKRL